MVIVAEHQRFRPASHAGVGAARSAPARGADAAIGRRVVRWGRHRAGGEDGGAARVPAPGLTAFPHGDGGDDQGGDGVGPGPAEGGVEDQADSNTPDR